MNTKNQKNRIKTVNKQHIIHLKRCALSLRLMSKMNRDDLHPGLQKQISQQIAQLHSGSKQEYDLVILRKMQSKHLEQQQDKQNIMQQNDEQINTNEQNNQFDKSELMEETTIEDDQLQPKDSASDDRAKTKQKSKSTSKKIKK